MHTGGQLMHTKIITTREQEQEEGNYVEGVVVQFKDKYFWLLDNGDCTLTDVSTADLAQADEYIAHTVFDAITLADKIDLHYSCLLYTSPSPRDGLLSRMPSSA